MLLQDGGAHDDDDDATVRNYESQITTFLAAAHETIAAVPICWLATRSRKAALTHARQFLRRAPGSDKWTRRILVRRNSRKVADIRAAPLVTLAYHILSGTAGHIGWAAAIVTTWPKSGRFGERNGPHFSTRFCRRQHGGDPIDVDRIEVHVRGLTAEPSAPAEPCWSARRRILALHPDLTTCWG